MATQVSIGLDKEAINGHAAIALALLSAWEDKRREERAGPTLEEISNRIGMLLDEHIAIRNLGLRRVPGGVYSEEVETFVGHLLAEGLATHRSPVQLTAEGEKLLGMIIRIESKERGSAIRRAAELLKLNTSEMLAGIV